MSRNCILTNFSLLIILGMLIFGTVACNSKRDANKTNNKQLSKTPPDSIQLIDVIFTTQWLHQAQFAGFYVAYEKGFYRDYGLNVIIEMGGPDDPSSSALVDKKTEFASMFLSKALRARDQGNQLINLAQLSQKSSFLLVAKKSSGIEKIQDMNNRKFGIWTSDFTEPTMIFLNKHKIKPIFVPVSWTTNVLANDVVDIMNMMVYNEYDIFVNTGYEPEELTIFPLSDYGVNIPEDGIYCLAEYYQQNQAICHDFAEASLQGWIYALNNEEETLSIVLDYLKRYHLPSNIPHQRLMLQKIKEAVLYKPEQFGKLTEEDYNSSASMMITNKIISSYVPYVKFIGYADSK